MYHIIHPLKMCSSLFLSVESCHLWPILEPFHHPKKETPYPLAAPHGPPSPSAPGKHQCSICLGLSYKRNHTFHGWFLSLSVLFSCIYVITCTSNVCSFIAESYNIVRNCLSIHQIIDVRTVSSFWLLWIKPLLAFTYKPFVCVCVCLSLYKYKIFVI